MEHGYRLVIVISIAAEALAVVILGLVLTGAYARAREIVCHVTRLSERRQNAKAAHLLGELAMQRLYMITVPGLEVKSDWAIVHDRLLDDFPRVTDVLATTMPATILIVYRGRAEIDGWLDTVSDTILCRRMSSAVRSRLTLSRSTGQTPAA
jgi:hypothetical protein